MNLKSNLRKLFIHIHERDGKDYVHLLRDGECADFDLQLLCNNLCDAAEEYYNNHPNKDVFNVGEIEIYTW